MRLFWLTLGALCVMLGAIGVALPLLPTTPFMLAAAFFFARSSPRLHRWLTEHPTFGPSIADWRDERAISGRAKRAATVAIIATLALSLALGVGWTILAIQSAALVAVLIFIWTRATPTAERGGG